MSWAIDMFFHQFSYLLLLTVPFHSISQSHIMQTFKFTKRNTCHAVTRKMMKWFWRSNFFFPFFFFPLRVLLVVWFLPKFLHVMATGTKWQKQFNKILSSWSQSQHWLFEWNGTVHFQMWSTQLDDESTCTQWVDEYTKSWWLDNESMCTGSRVETCQGVFFFFTSF